MGRKIVRVSAWTCRPLLFIFHKAVTLLFALFCIVSGLFARTAAIKDEVTLKGTARNNQDSTIISNLKLYLCSVAYPVYGMGFGPIFFPIDSTVTDPDGHFEFSFNRELDSEMAFVKYDTLNNAYTFIYPSAHIFRTKNLPDTFTIYLKPYITTDIKEKRIQQSMPTVEAVRGKRVYIKIGNWPAGVNGTVQIVDVLGKIVESPAVSNDGILIWDIEQVAGGSYFLRILTKNEKYHLPITVR